VLLEALASDSRPRNSRCRSRQRQPRKGRGSWIPFPCSWRSGEQLARGAALGDLAARFHDSIAAAAAALAARLAADAGIGLVALGGGCFQNARLLGSVTDRLEDSASAYWPHGR